MAASKRERYAEAVGAVEREILDALPEIIDRLIEKAKGGDMKAATYLCDRVLGRAAGLKRPPSEDHRPPAGEGGIDDFLSRLGAG